MKIDMHLHSEYSKDSMTPIDEIVKQIRDKDLDGFALTDHDTILGHEKAKALAKKNKLFFIPGVEWKTDKGDILVYNVKKLPKTKKFSEAVDFFRAQGCKIAIAHPFDYIRIREAVCDANFLEKSLDKFDFIELNGRCLPIFNKFAKKFSKRLDLKLIAGSDAHTLREYGNCYTELDKGWNLKGTVVKDSYFSIVNLLNGVVIFILKKILKLSKDVFKKRE